MTSIQLKFLFIRDILYNYYFVNINQILFKSANFIDNKFLYA